MTSPKLIAQALQVYNNMSGGGSGARQSQQITQGLAGGSEDVLRRIVHDLDQLKGQISDKKQNKVADRFKYLDDKNLYSTDG